MSGPFIEARLVCAHQGCLNEARYVDEDGDLTCGVCLSRHGADGIRISDVPRLLAWARTMEKFFDDIGSSGGPEIRDIIGRKP